MVGRGDWPSLPTYLLVGANGLSAAGGAPPLRSAPAVNGSFFEKWG